MKQYERFQKTYLSRAMTRAMSVDHPIGDPFGGAAYGERNDPISAIVSIAAMAGTATTAATLFTTGMTLASVSAGLAFAGSALSLVGNVTGNAGLMKFGNAAAMIGGLGMGVDALGNWLSSNGAVTQEAAKAAGQQVAGAADDSVSQAIVNANPVDDAMSAARMPAQVTTSPVPAIDDMVTGAVPGATPGTPLSVSGVQPYYDPNAPFANPTEMLGSGSATREAMAFNPNAAQNGFNAADDVLNAANPAANAGGGIVKDAAPFLDDQPFKAMDGLNTTSGPAKDWQYFTDDAGKAVAIGPDGKYFANVDGQGMRQITGAQGQQMGLLDKAGNLLGNSWRFVTDPANKELVKVGADAIGGAIQYAFPKPTDAAAAELYRAKAAQTRYQTALDKERREQLNRNLQSYVAQGVNENAVTVLPPRGLINNVRGV